MGDDALIPLHLFESSTFSMSTVLSVVVGFGMFGAMMALPLYLQLVNGATPTEAGLLMVPMIIGLMASSIVSGQLISRTGRYGIYPKIGAGSHDRRVRLPGVLELRQARVVHHDRDAAGGPRTRPADADPHARRAELGRGAGHRGSDRGLDVLPPDRWNARRRGDLLGAVQPASGCDRLGVRTHRPGAQRARRRARPRGRERPAERRHHGHRLRPDRGPDHRAAAARHRPHATPRPAARSSTRSWTASPTGCRPAAARDPGSTGSLDGDTSFLDRGRPQPVGAVPGRLRERDRHGVLGRRDRDVHRVRARASS